MIKAIVLGCFRLCVCVCVCVRVCGSNQPQLTLTTLVAATVV